MNHRRALRVSTDTGLIIFLIMIVGVVLWTSDTVLGWNILPDWIDKYAQLIVIIFSMLASFAVVISLMCSFAVLAESAAEKAGISSPALSPRVRKAVVVGIVLFLGAMFCLHKVDQYRDARRKEVAQQKKDARYDKAHTELGRSMDNIVPLFTSETRQILTSGEGREADESIAKLLRAIQMSTQHDPEVAVMTQAEPPYKYCVVSPLDEEEYYSRDEAWIKTQLDREFLTDLPSEWEREAIESLFEGREPEVAKNMPGVFVNTRRPSSWGMLREDDGVVGIVMLRGTI